MTNPMHVLAEAQLHELREANRLRTDRWAKASSQVVNGCLEAATEKFDANGIIARSYHTPIGSVVVTNVSGATVLVAAGPPAAGSSPTVTSTGKGLQQVPANFQGPMPLDDVAVTFYGTAGTVISFQVWTGLQPYGVLAS